MVVTDPMGVHARTALAISKIVRQGKSQVTLAKKNRQAKATEVLQIMTMVAELGERVEIEAIGPDAAAVADSLEPLFAGKFNDETQESA